MLYKKSYFYKADDFPEVIVNPRRELKSLANSCHIQLPLDPFENVDMEELVDKQKIKDNYSKEQKSQVFFDSDDSNGGAFKPHPLAWDSITYKSSDK